MKAIIPAAGYATRMYPLTKNVPKGLLPVGNKPMIEHIIGKIVAIPHVDKIFIVTNEKFFQAFLKWSKGFHCTIPIKILNDKTKSNETRLGSIGDIQFAIEEENIDDDILIVNSDNLFTFNLADMVSFFRQKGAPVIAAYDVMSVQEARKYGVSQLDASSKVIGFAEKPEKPKTTLCSIGIYLYPRRFVPLFSQYLKEKNSPDKTGEFVAWLYTRKEIFAFVYGKPEDQWVDIGNLELYKKVKNNAEWFS